MKKFLVGLILLAGGIALAQEVFVAPPLEFTVTPTRTALETVFMKAGNVPFSIEIPTTKDVGTVTLKLTEKTELEALLRLILDPNNLDFNKDANGVYHVKEKNKEAAVTTPRVTKLYALTYATAGELVRQIKGVLTKDGIVSVDVGTNSLIITDDPSVFEGAENLLKELDNPERKAKLISIKSKLLEIQRNSVTQMAIDYQYNRTAPTTLGGGVIATIPVATDFGTSALITGQPGFEFGPITWTGSMETVVAQLFATVSSTNVDFIAEPDVVVEDGTEARVQIGSKEPILTTTSTATGTTISYTYQDINIILTVTPQSQRDGTISVQINPQLNQIAGYRINSGTQVPVIDNREVRTKLFVGNGGTIRLGGILRDRTTTSESKVPFIGDIPLVGLLFKSTQPVSEKLDLQILVSPHIVDYAPPRCKDTPWISQLEASMVGEMDVKLDWSKDLPFGANGIFSYNVYRDTNPIASLEDRKPFSAGVDGQSTSWIDYSRKRKGGTYYYVVTAINPSGMEQSVSSDPKFNAVITIP